MMKTLVLLVLLIGATTSAAAQSCVIQFSTLPLSTSRVNTRGAANFWQLNRPALSFNGMDSNVGWPASQYGEGLRRALGAAVPSLTSALPRANP